MEVTNANLGSTVHPLFRYAFNDDVTGCANRPDDACDPQSCLRKERAKFVFGSLLPADVDHHFKIVGQERQPCPMIRSDETLNNQYFASGPCCTPTVPQNAAGLFVVPIMDDVA